MKEDLYKLITADYIYTPEGWVQDHVLSIEPAGGSVEGLRPMHEGDKAAYYQGYLIPGLVNAHCHLELSHLKGHIPRGGGMVDFVRRVIQVRGQYGEAVQLAAYKDALSQVALTGTALVADTQNTAHSADEAGNWLAVEPFFEYLGTNPTVAEDILAHGHRLLDAYADQSNIHQTLHAPYSVSPALRDLVMEQGSAKMSIHLLESEAERAFFVGDQGPFARLYEELGIHLFTPDATHPIGYITKGMPVDQSVIFVHLLEATEAELAYLADRFPNAWFCLCPRSNEYIHQKGPDLERFLPYADRICLGTDSLASNDSLNVWEEVQWIHQHFPTISLHQLVTWATYHGAMAIGKDRLMGSFQRGNFPGVNLINPAGELSVLRLT